MVCPYPYPWSPGGYPGLHSHRDMHPMEQPWNRGALWASDPFGEGRCCEFCDVLNTIPDIDLVLEQLAYQDPFQSSRIDQMYQGIHYHYMHGYDRNGSEAYHLARELTKFATVLQILYRQNPWWGSSLGDLATQMKYLSRGMQAGRRQRPRYHTFPQPRYWDGRYYPGEW